MSKIADLYAEISYKFESVKLREVSKYIGDMNISSVIATTSLVGLGLEMKGLIDQSSDLAKNIQILNTTTGVDPQYIQKLEHAAIVFQSSRQAADQWISGLSALQSKLTHGMGSQQAFTFSQMLGVTPPDFQKIIGNTEDLSDAMIKIMQKTWDSSMHMSKEQFDRNRALIMSFLPMSPDLLNAVNQPGFNEEMKNWQGFTTGQLAQINQSTQEWNKVVEKINQHFRVIATSYLPEITKLVDGFGKGSGMKDLFDFADKLVKLLNLSAKGWGMILHPENLVDMNKDALQRQQSDIIDHKIRNSVMSLLPHKDSLPRRGGSSGSWDKENKSANITVQVAPITIKTDNPQEFGKKFQDEFTKALDLATRQSPIGQT